MNKKDMKKMVYMVLAEAIELNYDEFEEALEVVLEVEKNHVVEFDEVPEELWPKEYARLAKAVSEVGEELLRKA